ncbi:MAG: glycogen-binding domain-containing protein [Bacteroidales bacterium]
MTRKTIYIILLVILLFRPGNSYSQGECRVENGKIIFRINLGWNESQRREFAQNFEIDSLVLLKVFAGIKPEATDSNLWEVKQIDINTIELSKLLEQTGIQNLYELQKMNSAVSSLPVQAPASSFGINKFNNPFVFRYKSGEASFYLPGFRQARSVMISGTFNGWSTMDTPLTRTDSGWVIRLKLPPGKYAYKYIIDGRWTEDPGNRLRERNDQRGFNSIVFCPNHLFMLDGNVKAKKVFLAGNFNDWRPFSLNMNKTQHGWELPAYLPEGTHFYKFIVDQEWITDPANPDKRPDSNGNMNSVVGIGDSYLFRLSGFSQARQVVLTGTFNRWRTDELLMEKTKDGWELRYILPAGTHEYKFIVDGQWITDPDNPCSTGKDDYKNSILAFHPNHTFVLKGFQTAREVMVSGSFNNWNRSGYNLYKQDGNWICPVYLAPGKYTYKFIVDGEWILDPGNKLWQENEYGTGNSVLWIEP